MPWIGDVKKEDAILALEHAQQSAATQDLFVRGKMAMVRLISDISRRREGYGRDYSSVSPGILVKVDDGQKVGRDVSLIARPDIEHRFFLRAKMLAEAGCSHGEK